MLIYRKKNTEEGSFKVTVQKEWNLAWKDKKNKQM
jgi:hypothetical protein